MSEERKEYYAAKYKSQKLKDNKSKESKDKQAVKQRDRTRKCRSKKNQVKGHFMALTEGGVQKKDEPTYNCVMKDGKLKF